MQEDKNMFHFIKETVSMGESEEISDCSKSYDECRDINANKFTQFLKNSNIKNAVSQELNSASQEPVEVVYFEEDNDEEHEGYYTHDDDALIPPEDYQQVTKKNMLYFSDLTENNAQSLHLPMIRTSLISDEESIYEGESIEESDSDLGRAQNPVRNIPKLEFCNIAQTHEINDENELDEDFGYK